LSKTEQGKGSGKDIAWTFPKAAGKEGLFSEEGKHLQYQLGEDETLVRKHALHNGLFLLLFWHAIFGMLVLYEKIMIILEIINSL